MIMDLSVRDKDYDLVRTTLQEIRPEMLLFTRRLRKIDISLKDGLINQPEGKIYSANLPHSLYSNVYAIQGTESKEDREYLVHQMPVYDMPDHSSRPDVRESKVILAFPFKNPHGPIIGKQHIFAFMPLRETSLSVTTLCSSNG